LENSSRIKKVLSGRHCKKDLFHLFCGFGIIVSMGESFKNLMPSIFREKHELLYKSELGSFFVEQFQTAKDRPTSQELEKAYPELYDFLMKKEGAKQFNVGILHIDPKGKKAKDFTKELKTGKEIIDFYKEDLSNSLASIAKEMKNNPDSDLGKIDFLTAASVLANQKRLPESLGFEIFEIDDNEKMKFKDSSHRFIPKTNKIRIEQGMLDKNSKSLDRAIKKASKIVLISREKILELYGN